MSFYFAKSASDMVERRRRDVRLHGVGAMYEIHRHLGVGRSEFLYTLP